MSSPPNRRGRVLSTAPAALGVRHRSGRPRRSAAPSGPAPWAAEGWRREVVRELLSNPRVNPNASTNVRLVKKPLRLLSEVCSSTFHFSFEFVFFFVWSWFSQ